MSMWEMCNNVQDTPHRKRNIPKLHRKKKGCSCTVVVQMSSGGKKTLWKFFFRGSISFNRKFKGIQGTQSLNLSSVLFTFAPAQAR